MAGNLASPARRLGAWAMAALLMAACGTSDSGSQATAAAGGQQQSGLTVMATTSILGDLVRNVVGDAASVEVLIPAGTDPHDYQPSSQAVSSIHSADLVVANGLLLEEGLLDALEAAADDGARVLLVAPLVDPIPFGLDRHEDSGPGQPTCEAGGLHDQAGQDHVGDEAGHAQGEGTCDPHVWQDPLRMAQAAHLVAAELAEVDGSVDWGANAEAYAAELEATHDEMVSMLEVVPEEERVLITNHDALGYFADRFGFEVAATVVPGGATLADPSSAELAALVELVRREGVPAIFTEAVDPSALAEAVAAEVGDSVQVVELYTDALGEPGSGADTLVGLLRTNARRVAEALG